MRIELQPQVVEPRLREPALETLPAQLAGHEALVVVEREPAAEDHPVDQPAPQVHAAQRIGDQLRGENCGPGDEVHRRAQRGPDVHIEHGEGEAEPDVRAQPTGQLAIREGQAPIRGDDERRDQPPRPPLRERKAQCEQGAAVAADVRQREDHADDRPEDGKERSPAEAAPRQQADRVRALAHGVDGASVTPAASSSRSISPQPKKALATPTTTSLSPASSGSVKAPFSSDRRPSGFLRSSGFR